MNAETFKKAGNTMRDIEAIDKEISDIDNLARQIADGKVDNIGFSITVSKPKTVNNKSILDDEGSLHIESIEDRIRKRGARLGFFFGFPGAEPECSNHASGPDSEAFSKNIPDTVALMILGQMLADLYDRRAAKVEYLKKLGVTFQ